MVRKKSTDYEDREKTGLTRERTGDSIFGRLNPLYQTAIFSVRLSQSTRYGPFLRSITVSS